MKEQKTKPKTLEGQTVEPTQIRTIDHLIIRDKETGLAVVDKRG